MSWNVVPEFIGTAGLLLMAISILRVYKLGKLNNRLLLLSCVVGMVSAMSNALSALCIGGQLSLPSIFDHLLTDMFYLSSAVATVLLVSYVVAVMNSEYECPKMVMFGNVMALVYCVVVLFFIVLNLFEPLVFYFNDDVYVGGPLRPWLTWLGLIYTLCVAAPMLYVWRRASKLVLTPTISAIGVGAGIMTVQLLVSDVLLQGLTFFACVLILGVGLLKRNMSYDQLSGCFNRNTFNIEMQSPRFKRSIRQICLVSLADYKKVDTEYGWEFGDRLIGEISAYLVSLTNHDSVFHITSTQFLCVFRSGNALKTVRRIAERFTRDWSLDGVYCHVPAEVSFYDCEENGLPEDVLSVLSFPIDNGSHVLGEPIICDKKLFAEMTADKRLVRVVKSALKENRIEWRYHPICNISNDAWNMVGVECVPYIRDDEQGLLAPEVFLKASNYSNFIEEDVNFSALKQICRLQERLVDVGADYIWLSCDLAKGQLTSQTTFNQLLTIIGNSNAAISNIRFKITYPDQGYDLEVYESSIAKLSQLGIGVIAADSGSSRITDLMFTPASTVRLGDRFVNKSDDSREDNSRFYDLVVNELRATGREVIASGILSGKRLAAAKSFGVKYGTGNYLSRARTEEELVNIVARDRASVCQMVWEDMNATDY